MSTDLGSFVGLGDSPAGSGMGSSGGGSLAPSPFRLPATYEEAKERKVAAVSDLRNAVKAVRPYLRLSLHIVKDVGLVVSGWTRGGASMPCRDLMLAVYFTAASQACLLCTLQRISPSPVFTLV